MKNKKLFVTYICGIILCGLGTLGIATATMPEKSADISPEPVVQHLDMDSELAQMAADVEPAEFVVAEEEFVVETPVYTEYQEPVYSEPVYTPAPVQDYGYSQYMNLGSSDFKSAGVWYDDSYRYTWYSSNVLYHYRTPEWTPNAEGIYTDADGYVVVASSDHPQGTVIENTPFGPAKVYDTGCASGTLDVYTNF